MSLDIFWAAAVCTGVKVSFACDAIEGLEGSATGGSVFLGACATGVCCSPAVFGEVPPALALEAVNGFLLVFARLELFQIDIESLADGYVGGFWGCHGDQGVCHSLVMVSLGWVLNPMDLAYRAARQSAVFFDFPNGICGGYISRDWEKWNNYVELPIFQVDLSSKFFYPDCCFCVH